LEGSDLTDSIFPFAFFRRKKSLDSRKCSEQCSGFCYGDFAIPEPALSDLQRNLGPASPHCIQLGEHAADLWLLHRGGQARTADSEAFALWHTS
jgi:hypothetical protein